VVFRSLPLPYAIYKSVCLELIAALCNGTEHYSNRGGVILCCLFVSNIYMRSYDFLSPPYLYLRVLSSAVSVCSLLLPCMLESTALRVGVKTLYNTMHITFCNLLYMF